MTRKELKAFYEKKTLLLELQSTIEWLHRYLDEVITGGGKARANIEAAISELLPKEAVLSSEINEKVDQVTDTIHRITDMKARVAAVLHYIEGNPWEVVAEMLRSTEDAVKSRVYKGFRNADIK